MCNTATCRFDDASAPLPTDEPIMIETTESAFIGVEEEEDEDVEEEEEEEDDVVEEKEDDVDEKEEGDVDEDEEESLEGVGKMIQDLFRSDNAKANAALYAMNLELGKNEKNCESFVTAGGCFVLVQLMKNCLDKAIDRILACDQVTELNELAELTTLDNTLCIIIRLTFQHAESRVGISAIGGVEAIVKVIKTFPKCQSLQMNACSCLVNLVLCSIGRKKAAASGGIKVVLATINNHLGSVVICQRACLALANIASGSKEHTGLLISLGGGAAMAKVRTKWPNDEDVQSKVRKLATMIIAEMKAWVDKE
jgi:hypothetical protein